VVGIDVEVETVRYARARYGAPPNLGFVQADASAIPLKTASFDVVCSFETIEHLHDVSAYLAEVRRVLTPTGVFVVSTPHAQRSTGSPSNPHHVQEWSSEDFRSLLSTYFVQVRFFGQRRKETASLVWLRRLDALKLRSRWAAPPLRRRVAALAGVRINEDLQLGDFVIEPRVVPQTTEMIVVCSGSVSAH
jgi:SAM-dependent methyltransferase